MLDGVYNTDGKYLKAKKIAIREIQEQQSNGRTIRRMEMLYFLAGYFHNEHLDLYTALEVCEDISSLLTD